MNNQKLRTVIGEILMTNPKNITYIKPLKRGMTNQSFLFQYKGQRYILRIPGKGTEQMINRINEAAVYRLLKNTGICDEVLCFHPETGYKITKYFENARVCNPSNPEDVAKCMDRLRQFHQMSLQVKHRFDLWQQIDFYESLKMGVSSLYPDYFETKQKIYSLRPLVESFDSPEILTHMDAIYDNFLFVPEKGHEKIYLIDWEYAGMQDSHVDIAMFGIYALYDQCQMELLIQEYFQGCCSSQNKIKIYCYVAICGLLWSNWCEYKKYSGAQLEDETYALRQYQYAQEYYRIVCDELGGGEKKMGYLVENAVILAAGTSSRFAPLSYERPKALVRVQGEILIERQIRQLQERNISDITIVTGYKSDQFKYLSNINGITIVENKDYLIRNNHSSIYAVKNRLGNTYVCSADNYFSINPFNAEEAEAYYAAVFSPGPTTEWCLQTDKDDWITNITIGGTGKWYMMGHTFWSREFSENFIHILESVYKKECTKPKLWEDIYKEHITSLKMKIRRYQTGQIHEFDTLDDLRVFDAKYLTDSGSAIMKLLSQKLNCSESELREIKPLKAKGAVIGIQFLCHNKIYQFNYERQHLYCVQK